MANILVVEDDKKLNKGVTFSLKKAGHNVESAYNLAEAKFILLNSVVELILLDIGLPDGSGLDLCKTFCKTKKIVLFTANDTEVDMIKGFEMGCDDYIPKPFSLEVLNYKLKAILNNQKANDENIFNYLDLKIDYSKGTVIFQGVTLNLTPREYKLLELLTKNKKWVLTKEIILEQLWDSSGNFVDENTISVNIRRLRKKLLEDAKAPKYIITVFGIGYTFGEENGKWFK